MLLQNRLFVYPEKGGREGGVASSQDSPSVLVWVSVDSSGPGTGVSPEAPGTSSSSAPSGDLCRLKIVLSSSF